jgi:hypothetical protein
MATLATRQFVDTFLLTFNPVAAVEAGGIDKDETVAEALARHMTTSAELLEDLASRSAMSQAIITAYLTRMALVSIADFGNVDEEGVWTFNLAAAVESGAASAVKKFTIDTRQKMTIELVDKLDIVDTLLKLLGADISVRTQRGSRDAAALEGSITSDLMANIRKQVLAFEKELTDGDDGEDD